MMKHGRRVEVRGVVILVALCAAAGCSGAITEPLAPRDVQARDPRAAGSVSAPAAARFCADDAEEDNDRPNINQGARWMAEARQPPTAWVSCPGDVDYIQALGDWGFSAEVTWDPTAGSLDISFVSAADAPYDFQRQPHSGTEQPGISRSTGRVRISGGSHRQFIRVINTGSARIPYAIRMSGVWGE